MELKDRPLKRRTLRDDFAAQALQNTSSIRPQSGWQWLRWAFGMSFVGCSVDPKVAAAFAYKVADAMLAERAKK